MYSLLSLISTVIQIYIYVLIASAVLSWLIAFNVVNTRNQAVAMIADALWRLTEPVLAADPANPAESRRPRPLAGGADPDPVLRTEPDVRNLLQRCDLTGLGWYRKERDAIVVSIRVTAKADRDAFDGIGVLCRRTSRAEGAGAGAPRGGGGQRCRGQARRTELQAAEIGRQHRCRGAAQRLKTIRVAGEPGELALRLLAAAEPKRPEGD